MTAVIVIVVIVVIVALALVVVAPRMGGTRLGGLGRSRRPRATDRTGVPSGRAQKIHQRVETQVARDRASTLRRWQAKGRAEASPLALDTDPPDEFGRPLAVDEFGRPLVGRSRVEEDSAEVELRDAADGARAARFASSEAEPRAAYGRRRRWPPRPGRDAPPPPPPIDGRDDRFVP